MGEYTIRSEHASVVAIDQHARSVALAAADLATGESRCGRLSGCPSASDIAAWASWASRPARFVYESGPCGFQLARDLRAMGLDCDVIAVSTIPRSADDRSLKDDGRDARALLDAVLSPGSRCRAVWLPSEEAEGARDAVRAYFDQSRAARALKQQTSGMLLRHGLVWNERCPRSGRLRKTWGRDYVAWARSAPIADPTSRATLSSYVDATVAACDRLSRLRRGLSEVCALPRWKPVVDALCRLKGVDEVAALAFASVVDDFSRFPNGRSVSRYFGLTPSRRDSGERVGRGGHITKAGDSTVRLAVVEGLSNLPAWTGARKPARPGHEASAAVEAEAAKCNERNLRRYRALVGAGKRPNVAKTAVASELVRQMWVLGSIADRERAGG